MPVDALARAPERRGEAKAPAILAALERMLEERPLADIAIADIAREAGVTRSGFYFYFASKEAAVGALLSDITQMALPEITAWTRDTTAPPRARIDDALRRALAIWREHRTLVLALADAAARDPATRELNEQWMATFMAVTARRIDEERAAGRAPAGVDADMLANALLCMNERSVERGLRAAESRAAWDVRVGVLVDVWTKSIYGGDA